MSEDKTKNGFTLNKKWGGIFGKDIASPLGRLAFVSLDKPTGMAGTTPKFGFTLLVDKTDKKELEFLKAIQEMYKLMCADLWGAKAPEMVAKFKYPVFRDGDEPSTAGKVYEGFEGKWVLVCKNPRGPGQVNGITIKPDATPIEKFEAGVIVRATIQPYVGPDGVSYQARAVKLVNDDGVRFGGAPDPTGVIDHLDDAVAAVNTAQEFQL